jgi:glycerol-3-phosphate O-acyltransferase / dihydroxyacetone phosphate acyltransferase
VEGLTGAITRAVGWTASVFYRLERRGPDIPDGPVLVVANHPNSLLDPLVVFRTAGRPTRPLAKAPLFDQVFVGAMLRGLGGLPVYRRQDDASQMHRNDETFRRAIDALRAGDAVQIYPEGLSHSEPSLVPLRTGAARIALGAEAASSWQLGLRIVPVGLTYRRKALFRGRALATIGAAFTIAHHRTAWEADPATAVRVLTDDMARALESVTLNLTRAEDEPLIETAERLYTRAKGVARWRERAALADRLPRLQAFARGLAWLRANDTPRFERLARDVRAYERRSRLLGAADADVPPRYRAGGVLRYALVEFLVLALGLPLAALGALLWYPAYVAPRAAVRRIRPEAEAVATYKLATGFVAMPATVLVAAALAWWLGGPWWALGCALAMPALGFLALGWRERWGRVRDDVRLFFRVLRHPRGRDRLAAQRERLVAAFDDVLARMEEEGAPALIGPEATARRTT